MAGYALPSPVGVGQQGILKNRRGKGMAGFAEFSLCFDQVAAMVRSVGIMAQFALAVMDGLVDDSVFERFSVVAFKTELKSGFSQEFFLGGKMRGVTA